MIKPKWTTQGNYVTAQINFGIYDSKGREIGAQATIQLEAIDYDGSHGTSEGEPNAQQWDNGAWFVIGKRVCQWTGVERTYSFPTRHKFCTFAHISRNNKQFGGARSQYDVTSTTLEEAKAVALAKVETIRKRAVAKAASNGGIYK